MEYFTVRGGHPLKGTIPVQGAKNSALPILAATLLAQGESVIHNCPDLSDVTTALGILTSLGCRVERQGDTVRVDTSCRSGTAIPHDLMGKMRASVLFLGALLARSGEVTACWPGGCALGDRPIDLHIRAFQALGAQVEDREGELRCRVPGTLRGRRLALPFPSVGATENTMLTACGAQGITVLDNAAREPEIVDLQGFLQTLGADITGAGTSRIIIRGGRPLRPGTYRVMADRIVTATYLCAVASAGGQGELLGTDGGDLLPVLHALERGGCRVERAWDRVSIQAQEPLRGIGTVTTGPYPAFPTDAQPLLGAALAAGRGESTLIETIFDHRFRYTQGLRAMGAKIRVEGPAAHITGTPLRGARVEAADLRGGAALTIAALGAGGESQITGLAYLDRGYEDLAGGLKRLGADIQRIRNL